MTTTESALHIDSIPWSRIVHFYGRASLFPTIIRRIVTGQEIASDVAMLASIEHQDSVIQATPFTMLCLVDYLRSGPVSTGIRELCATTLRSARYQVTCLPRTSRLMPLADLLSESQLWPDYQSEEADEAYWEDWRPTELEHFAWAAHTIAILSSISFD